VLRFLVGLLEACAFPGYAALLGGWYGRKQLSKRMAIFEQTSAIAAMFSGYLQAALYAGMNGKLGLSGWRCKVHDAKTIARLVADKSLQGYSFLMG
jgi:MFS transporter, ACS family, pantothenate transporter